MGNNGNRSEIQNKILSGASPRSHLQEEPFFDTFKNKTGEQNFIQNALTQSTSVIYPTMADRR